MQTHKQYIITEHIQIFSGILAVDEAISQAEAFYIMQDETEWMTKQYFLKRCQGLPKQTWRGVVLPELQRAACSALWRMLAVTALRVLSQSALFKWMYMGQQWKPDKLVLWLSRQRRSKYGAAGRLASSRSYWPSWMLFHPFQWLIQNQLSHPSGPFAGCKLASFLGSHKDKKLWSLACLLWLGYPQLLRPLCTKWIYQ